MKAFHLILFVGFFFGFQVEARTLDEIKKSGVLKVAADGATPPFNSYSGKTLVGFEIELAELFAKRMGLKVEWKVQPFSTLLISVEQDQFDLIATSHAITPAREKAVDFANPHYCTGAVIVSKVNGPKTLKDLKGKKIVVPVGTVYYDVLKKHEEIGEVRTVPNETDGLQVLVADRVDAWATDQFVAYEAIEKQKSLGLAVGEQINQQRNAMVVKKGNRPLLDEVNRQLAAALKDGSYTKLSQRYFRRDIRCK